MEKRGSKRINKRLAVNFGIEELDCTGITNDISQTGLFIRTTKFYAPGSIVKINLLVPNNGSVTFEGKVIRTYKQPPYSCLAKNGVAIELDGEEKTYLAFVTSLQD
jgi:hypothetical protein